MQILLQQHLPKSNPLVSMSIFAPPCFLLLLPVALSFEPGAFATLAEPAVGVVVLLNTLTAFVLNLAVVILVQKGSGLILTLAGIVKDIALIVASIFIFANPVTPIQVRQAITLLRAGITLSAHAPLPPLHVYQHIPCVFPLFLSSQVIGYTLALLGLNMYNLYKTNKDSNMSIAELTKQSVTNKQAIFVVVGALVLFVMSAQSMAAYREEAAAAGESGSADTAARRLLIQI